MPENERVPRASRRQYLAAGGLTALVGVAGCLDFLDDGVEFRASPSRASESAQEETGYDLVEHTEDEIEREFEAGGESQTVSVINVNAEHTKTIGAEPLGEVEAALFVSTTTPQVTVLGQTFNPIAEMSAAQLAEMVQDEYDGIENVEQQEITEQTINGQTTNQTKFSADAGFEGSPVQMYLHVSEAVELGDDFVVTIGAYPALTPGEEENILTLMESVEADE